MNESMLRSLTNDELLRYVDRSDPHVNELAKRFELVLDFVDSIVNGAEMESAEARDAD